MSEKYRQLVEMSSISELQAEQAALTATINKKQIKLDNLCAKRELISQRLSQLIPSEVKNG